MDKKSNQGQLFLTGARSDLLALAQVTYVKSRTTRIFWDNGYKTVGAVAAANVHELDPVLLQVSALLFTGTRGATANVDHLYRRRVESHNSTRMMTRNTTKSYCLRLRLSYRSATQILGEYGDSLNKKLQDSTATLGHRI